MSWSLEKSTDRERSKLSTARLADLEYGGWHAAPDGVDFTTIDKAITCLPTCEVGYTDASACPTALRVGGCERQGSRQTMAALNNVELVTIWYYGPKKTAADVKSDCKYGGNAGFDRATAARPTSTIKGSVTETLQDLSSFIALSPDDFDNLSTGVYTGSSGLLRTPLF